MDRRLSCVVAVIALAGCGERASAPAAASPPLEAPTVPRRLSAPPSPKPVQVALLEPYLFPVKAGAVALPPPSTMSGQIVPAEPILPLTPSSPPLVARPVAPPPATPPSRATPARPATVPPALVKLMEDERARSVEDARRRLAVASARAATAAAEAKKTWSYVKDGFVAQKQADAAEAATRAAVAEQAEAQKSLDDAVQRQRESRRDVEAAYRTVASRDASFQLSALPLPIPTFRAVPNIYRLSVLGTGPVSISIQNGTLGRRLPTSLGEAGAWIVRCPDPHKLRGGVGDRPLTIVVRILPSPEVVAKA